MQRESGQERAVTNRRLTWQKGADSMAKTNPKNKRPGGAVIFRPWRRDPKTGEVLWARDYGLKAWPIPVDGKDAA